LAAVWRDVLKRHPIGLDDNFFELGGHSLMAARLFVRIEKTLGVRLPLATLIQSPTIRTLAARIEEVDPSAKWSSLVPIQPDGTKPPLFLVHGAEGNVLLYRSLAASLGSDQPVYGLQSQGLDGSELFEPKLESIAEGYCRELQSVQPAGPYYLGGYCLGGTIAFEMARQLKQAGESVALLAMFETYNVHSKPPVSIGLRMFHKAQNLYFQARNLALSGGSAKFFGEKWRVEISRLMIQWDFWRARIINRFRPGQQAGYQHLRIRAANHQAQAAYQPSPYDGAIMLFRPEGHFRGYDDRCYGWERVAVHGVQIIDLPNYPRGSLNQPFVGIVARRLKTEIENTLDVEAERLAG